MKRLQVTIAAATLTFCLSTASFAGTITGSRTSSVGTITGSSTGTITGSSTGTITGSRAGTITGSRAGTITGSFGIVPDSTYSRLMSKLMILMIDLQF